MNIIYEDHSLEREDVFWDLLSKESLKNVWNKEYEIWDGIAKVDE